MLEVNAPLVVKYSFKVKGEEIEDVKQEMRFALMKAAESFDPEKGIAFSTYAGNAMNFAAYEIYRKSMFSRDASIKINSAIDFFEKQGIFNPTDNQMADYLKMTPQEFSKLKENSGRGVRKISLDEQILNEKGDLWNKGFYLASEENTIDNYNKKESSNKLWTAIGLLPNEQRELIIDKFVKEMTFKELSQKNNKTSPSVQRNLTTACKNLKFFLLDRWGQKLVKTKEILDENYSEFCDEKTIAERLNDKRISVDDLADLLSLKQISGISKLRIKKSNTNFNVEKISPKFLVESVEMIVNEKQSNPEKLKRLERELVSTQPQGKWIEREL